jgi:hypothetical protein
MERVRRAVAVEIEKPPPGLYAVEEQYRRIVEEVAALARAAPVTPRPRRRGEGAYEPPRRAGRGSDSLEHHGGALSAADAQSGHAVIYTVYLHLSRLGANYSGA